MQSGKNRELYIFHHVNIEERHAGNLQHSVWWLTVQCWSDFTAGTRPDTKSWKNNYIETEKTVIILIIFAALN